MAGGSVKIRFRDYRVRTGKERKAEQNEQSQHHEIGDHEPDLLGQLRGIGKEGTILHWSGLSKRRGASDPTQDIRRRWRRSGSPTALILTARTARPGIPISRASAAKGASSFGCG